MLLDSVSTVGFMCSLWDYTHVVMNYLCGKCGTDGGTPRDDEWLSYFDVVVTGRWDDSPSSASQGHTWWSCVLKGLFVVAQCETQFFHGWEQSTSVRGRYKNRHATKYRLRHAHGTGESFKNFRMGAFILHWFVADNSSRLFLNWYSCLLLQIGGVGIQITSLPDPHVKQACRVFQACIES